MEKELNEILEKLRKSNTNKDPQLIDKHIKELNKLWEENAADIIRNGEKDGFRFPKNMNNEN